MRPWEMDMIRPFLAQLAGQVYAFDIQEQALVNTQERLEKLGLQHVRLILDGHQHVDQYVETIKAAIFNLGYLPSADKSVITLPATTIEAMEKICVRLEKRWANGYYDLLWS